MNNICPYCSALRFPNEPLNCCHNGKVSLPSLSRYPEELKDLLLGNGSQAKGLENTLDDTTVHLHLHPYEQKLTDQHLEGHIVSVYMVKYIIELDVYIHLRKITISMGKYIYWKGIKQWQVE